MKISIDQGSDTVSVRAHRDGEEVAKWQFLKESDFEGVDVHFSPMTPLDSIEVGTDGDSARVEVLGYNAQPNIITMRSEEPHG